MEGESSQLHNRRRCLNPVRGHYSPDKSSRRETLHDTEFPSIAQRREIDAGLIQPVVPRAVDYSPLFIAQLKARRRGSHKRRLIELVQPLPQRHLTVHGPIAAGLGNIAGSKR
jgi:hypothetical protein